MAHSEVTIFRENTQYKIKSDNGKKYHVNVEVRSPKPFLLDFNTLSIYTRPGNVCQKA